mgnify:FL=1
MRARLRLTAAVAALACLAGCASVPSGGRVTSGRPAERAEPIAEPYVRVVPVSPRPGWAPDKIVKGFLIASSAFNDDYKVARQYLTSSADAAWRPGPRPQVIVLDGEPIISAPREAGGEMLVEVTATRLGHIGSDGQYTAQPGGAYTATFALQSNSAGQWRISRMPAELRDGLLLSQSDVDRVFRVLNLYFFDPDGKVLVPNAVFLPLVNRQRLARQLVAALLAGPTTWLKPAVRSYFPSGTRLQDVDISDGVATVSLSAEAYRGDHERMSAQLTWTLQRLPEVRRVRLQIDGDAIEPGGVGPIQAPEDWEEYNSDTSEGGTEETVYLRGPDGRPHQLHDNDVTTPANTSGRDRLHRPALSPHDGRSRIAGLNADGDTVLSGDLLGGTPIRPVMWAEHSDGRFTPPSWDLRGWLWSVESFSGGSSLWLRQRDRQPVRIRQWELSGHRVVAFRVARDGVRVAAIVKIGDSRQLRLGRIVRDAKGVISVGGFLPISPELVDVTDLAWGDSTSLAVLGRTKLTETQVTPYWVPVNGGDILPVGTASQGEAESITAAPGSRIVIGARINGEDNICRQSSLRDWRFDQWKCAPLGSDPTYWS